MKIRLDYAMFEQGLVPTRSQAESWIELGHVTVDGRTVRKPGYFVSDTAVIILDAPEKFVSRAGLKLASVAKKLQVDFTDKIVLDVGSSTGGFTDYALQHNAKKIYAVDVGTDQMHPSLRNNPRIELHEKTDIRKFTMSVIPDIIVIDVSFVSLREILPSVLCLSGETTNVIAMVKPQFEAGKGQLGNSGVVKNDRVRRDILREFELWARHIFILKHKADSEVAGASGNRERFYVLRPIKK